MCTNDNHSPNNLTLLYRSVLFSIFVFFLLFIFSLVFYLPTLTPILFISSPILGNCQMHQSLFISFCFFDQNHINNIYNILYITCIISSAHHQNTPPPLLALTMTSILSRLRFSLEYDPSTSSISPPPPPSL